MDMKQKLEWAEAQRIAISVDFFAAAKQQLRFLAEVYKNPQLHDGPALDRAIHRYKYCWLPLLAKHVEGQVSEGAVVVPLDCEWIWHCHRLNPVRYIVDCKQLYGKILGNRNVVSSTEAIYKDQTEEIWNQMYPDEPYELNMNIQISSATDRSISTTYDLISAVKRQSSFYYQVSGSYMNDDAYLEGSVARYRGFLHLIKRNQERALGEFCVPTYDIDLIWHAHQLQPVAYCEDLVGMMGRVLDHDDTDSDRAKGHKLDTGFSGTTKQWEDTFGSRYCRAGAMYRGNAPSPLAINATKLGLLSNKVEDSNQISKEMFVEVMVEIMEVRDIPAEHKGNLVITFSKKQPDMLFQGQTRLSILSERKEKQIAVFQCEPVGELVCELVSHSPTACAAKVLGATSISLQEFMKPAGSPLSVEKWLKLMPNSETAVISELISLHTAISFTTPIAAPVMQNSVKMDGGGNCNGGSNYNHVPQCDISCIIANRVKSIDFGYTACSCISGGCGGGACGGGSCLGGGCGHENK
ncbi:glycine-rich domain-containing protein 1-like [Mercurialis annua]|uniref:glycine-rich domain-containing protein 1-like n=1 Tax=Mercurialis annua TaxID=3986 RepID=UPI00215F1B01|nr:glycine-rich domain-containing protein 1-like [Mercurialis annua]